LAARAIIDKDQASSTIFHASHVGLGCRIIRTSLIITALIGFAFVIYLIVDSGAGDVASAMLTIGWWLLPITLFHLVPLLFSTLSWRQLLPPSTRPDVLSAGWMRWIRESINSLLPVASVGGDLVNARLAYLRGVPGAQAAASMVVDTTVGVMTQLVFVIVGVILLLATRATEEAALRVTFTVLIGVGLFIAIIATFVLVQHRSMFAMFAAFTRRLGSQRWLAGFAGDASTIDDVVVATYKSGFAFLKANVLRLIGWAAGTGEIWLVMQSLDHPLSLIDAFILESLGSGVRAAAFVVPGALGALEGGFVLFGALFGLSSDIALAISLTKRVRELLLGLPGLFVWHIIEARYLRTARITSNTAMESSGGAEGR
jgi:putative membrane protein